MNRLVPFLIGLLGMVAALVGWHLYDDHRLLDSIRVNLQQQQQRQAAPKVP